MVKRDKVMLRYQRSTSESAEQVLQEMLTLLPKCDDSTWEKLDNALSNVTRDGEMPSFSDPGARTVRYCSNLGFND